MRVLISLQTSKTTVYFESASREFLSVQQRRVSHTLDPPKQRAKDICNAFGRRCLTERRLKAALTKSRSSSLRECVVAFVERVGSYEEMQLMPSWVEVLLLIPLSMFELVLPLFLSLTSNLTLPLD